MANAIYNFFFSLLDHEVLSSTPSAYFNNGWNAIKQLFNAFFSSR